MIVTISIDPGLRLNSLLLKLRPATGLEGGRVALGKARRDLGAV